MKKKGFWKSVSALLLAFAMCVAQAQPVVLAAGGSAGSSSNLALNKTVTYSGVEGDKVNGGGEQEFVRRLDLSSVCG